MKGPNMLLVRIGCLSLLACATVMLTPTEARAQARAGSIVGVISDASGAVLPGVSVAATSPALTEQRNAVSDGAGRYALVDLRPGIYTVVFALQGFQSVRREGIILEGSFAAPVNATLTIGALEESITVSSASPVVDIQNTGNQLVTNKQVLELLPSSRQLQSGLSLVPGVVSFNSSSSAPGVQDFWVNRQSVRGSPTGDSNYRNDGLATNSMMIGTGSQPKSGGINDLAQEEIVYDAGGLSAEFASAGVRGDTIPKEGGNRYSGTLRALGQRPNWQTSNLTDELAQSISAVNKIDFNWETNVGVGGPIIRDKMWFYSAFRLNQFELLATDQFWPDGRQAGSGGHVNPNGTARITYQATPRNKIAATYQGSTSLIDRYDFDSRTSPEAGFSVGAPVNWSGAVKWTSPLTNRLLVDVGQSYSVATYQYKYQPSVGPLDVSYFNQSTGLRSVATNIPVYDLNQTVNTVANVSYVTGSHALKTGANLIMGTERQQNQYHGDMSQLNFLNVNNITTPVSVVVRNSPVDSHNDVKASLGLFVQDKWSVNRLTLIAGGRFDHLKAEVPAQTLPAGNFVPVRLGPAIACTPCWSDWSARFSASYDLFGTGKTALKGAVGKYVSSQLMTIAATVNPMRTQSDTRNWNDLDRNGRALDSNGNVQYNEIGPSTNANFGLPRGATLFDAATPRPTDWEQSVLLQHELLAGVSVSAGYYHHSYYDLSLTKNTAVNPDTDFTPFTIVGPADARLPGGGSEVMTQYNLVPSKLGAVNSVSTFSATNSREYHGFEVSGNARLPKGGFLFGSVTTERVATSDCDLANNDPNNRRFCEQTPPFRSLFKISGGYPLPFDIQLSGTVQLRPGESIPATYSYNSLIAGVPLTGGGSRSVNLANPTELYYDYIKTIDARVARSFRFGTRRAQVFVEIFNLPNLSTVLQVNTVYGALWLRPTVITQARRFQLGGQFDF
jgi:hypothetical protein